MKTVNYNRSNSCMIISYIIDSCKKGKCTATKTLSTINSLLPQVQKCKVLSKSFAKGPVTSKALKLSRAIRNRRARFVSVNKSEFIKKTILNSNLQLNIITKAYINSIKEPVTTIKKAMDIKDFEIINIIGVGCYSEVKLAKWIAKDNKPCVLKVINKQIALQMKQARNLLREQQLTQSLKHSFIINWYIIDLNIVMIHLRMRRIYIL